MNSIAGDLSSNSASSDAPRTTAEAFAFFDTLDPVEINFMVGRWQGAGFYSNHPMDGLLEATGWYGKEFIDAERVHPLIFLDHRGRPFTVNPAMIPIALSLKLELPANLITRFLFLSLKGLIQTSKTTARVRMTEYRGQISATMIYDHKPILDVFRAIDPNTVLGVMDMKGMTQPFFFKLIRDTGKS